MKKKPLKFPKADIEFEVPIYGGVVFLFKKEAKLNEALDYLGHADSARANMGGVCNHLESKDGLALYLVGWYTGSPSTLVHECGHLTMFILQRAGIAPTDSVGEAYCYLLEELVRRFGIDKKPLAKTARRVVVAWMNKHGTLCSAHAKAECSLSGYDIPLYK